VKALKLASVLMLLKLHMQKSYLQPVLTREADYSCLVMALIMYLCQPSVCLNIQPYLFYFGINYHCPVLGLTNSLTLCQTASMGLACKNVLGI
jgi:hypothetical protein